MKKILTLLFVIIGLTAFSQQNLTLKTLKVDTVRGRTNLKINLKDTLVFKDGSKQWTAPTGSTYSAGTGLTLTSSTFSVKPFDTSLTTRYWSDTFTVTRIDTNTIRFYVSDRIS